MTDTRKVQLGAEFDASGAKKGFEDVKAGAREMAQAVGQAGQVAAKGVDGIGAGGDQAAKKLDQSTRSIIGSIERTTAAMQAGQRGSAEYFENLARQRGVSTDTLKPYLDQLRQAEAAQRVAAGSLDKMGVSAKQTAAALRGVPAQFTDIITALQGGQAPLTVLLQQGGQLKDMFGGVGAAAKALGGFMLGLVNPFTIVAAGAAGLAYAYNASASEQTAFARSLILTGNAAGQTAGQLTDMARALNQAGAGTQGRAAEILAQIAGSAAMGAENMQRFTAAALRFETVGGPAAEETAKAFASLAKDPLAGALKLNEATNFLTKSVYDQIKALEDQGRTVDAARVAQEAYAGAIESRTPQILQSLGTIERTWLRIKEGTKGGVDALLAIGRAPGTQEQVAALRNRIASVQAGNEGSEGKSRLPELQAQLQALQQGAKYEAQSAYYEAQAAAARKEAFEWAQQGDKFLDKQAQMKRDITRAETEGRRLVVAGLITERDLTERIAAIRAKYTEKSTGTPGDPFAADRSAAKEWAQFYERFANAAADAEGKVGQLTKTQVELVKFLESPAYQQMSEPARQLALQQAYAAISGEQLNIANKEAAKVAEEAAKAYAKWIGELEHSADAVEKQLDQMRLEEQATALTVGGYRSLAQAIQEVEIARLRERQAALLSYGDEAGAAAIQREIEARRQLIDAIGTKEARAAADDAAKEWKRSAERIEDSITDALLRGFESGKGFARTLRDTVVNMFKTMVLRPIVSAIVNPVAGAISGAMGLSGAANAAGTVASGGGALGSLGSLGSIAGIAGSIGAFGTAAGYGAAALFGGTGLTALSGGASMVAAGSVASGLGMIAGVLGPIALGLAVVASLLKDKSATLGYAGGQFGAAGDYSKAPGGPFVSFGNGNTQFNAGLQKVTDTFAETLAGAAKSFGGNVAGLQVFTGTDVDRKGKGSGTIQILRDGRVLGGVQTGGGDVRSAAAEKIDANNLGQFFADASSAALIAGLQQSDLPARFKEYFSGFSAGALTKTEADKILATASAVQTLTDKLAGLGGSFSKIAALSIASVDNLAALFGGIDNLNASVDAYYRNFYSDAERSARTAQQLAAEFGKLGLATPGTLAQFRALVDAQDLSTEAGRRSYATLISLSGAFAELKNGASGATDTIQAEIDRLRGIAGRGQSAAELQVSFVLTSAQARAGDTKALQALPGISQALEEAAKAAAASALDVARMREWLARSLTDTIGKVPGFAAGGAFVGGLRVVGENGPELEVTGPSRIFDASTTARMLNSGTDRLEAQIAVLNDRIATVADAVRATALHTAKTARQLERAMPDGDAIATRTAVD